MRSRRVIVIIVVIIAAVAGWYYYGQQTAANNGALDALGHDRGDRDQSPHDPRRERDGRSMLLKGIKSRQGQRLVDIHSETTNSNERITSPIDGVVLERLVEPEEFAPPGSTVMVVAELDALTLKVYVPENRYGQISLGQDVPGGGRFVPRGNVSGQSHANLRQSRIHPAQRADEGQPPDDRLRRQACPGAVRRQAQTRHARRRDVYGTSIPSRIIPPVPSG